MDTCHFYHPAQDFHCFHGCLIRTLAVQMSESRFNFLLVENHSKLGFLDSLGITFWFIIQVVAKQMILNICQGFKHVEPNS